ncbi:MAG: sialate O-acetylesterase [Huintestinicola sp.]
MSILSAAAVFSSHMVIQKGKPVSVWGMDYSGRKVTVSFCGKSVSVTAEDNKWSAVLPPVNEYGGPYEMVITDSCGEKVVFEDVMVGEVWLAGGQSNMEFELQNCSTGADELKNISEVGKNVRFYYTKKNPYIDEFFYADERNNGWALADSEGSRYWSAVGYYFAKKLSAELGAVVGVIGCNWGGTSASAWMSRSRLESDKDTRSYVDEYEKAMEGKTFEQYLEELEDYRRWEREWQPKINEYYSLHPEDGSWEEAQEYAGSPSRWPEPLGPKSPFRASGLYETMLKRVMPYTLAGFIYYQGESDDHKPNIYCKLFKMMIDEWRSGWNDNTLPFICVQLPMFINKGEEDRKNWCLIREAQMKMHLTTANTGIAVALDCGEFNNIHPVNKVPVGERLALQALFHTYGKISEDMAYGPVYKDSYPADGGMMIEFDHAADGFELRGEEKASGFELAGADKIYYPASAEILEGGRILLRSENVSEPVYARFKWVNYGEVTLYGKNGIPAAPFRTSPEA